MSHKQNVQFTEVLAIIANHDGITLDEISRKTGISKDFLNANTTSFNENMENLNWSVSYDNEEENEEPLWYMDHKLEECCYLPLTRMESVLFNYMIGKGKVTFNSSPILMKELYKVEFDERKIVQIITAIEKKKVLDISYKKADHLVMDFTLKPVALYYYELENLFYVAGQFEDDFFFYRLDRIQKISESKDSFKIADEEAVLDLVQNVFGMELGQKTRIKVRFFNEGNVLRKVRREASHLSSMLIEDEKGILLEGTIQGVTKMKAWVRSFGSSAIVLEPDWLRQEMIEAAEKCLSYYEVENG